MSLLAHRYRPWRSPLAPAAVLFLASLAWALHESLRATQGRLVYALDDAYIHMAVARNLASHGVWGCTPFHFSSSSSSLLWTLVLSLSYRLLGVRDWAPLALNVVFSLLTLAVAERALARFGVAPLVRASALVGLVIAVPLPGMVLLGMEHTLHLLLTLAFAAAAALALTSPGEPAATRRTIELAALAALLAASRYEGFFLVGLAGLGFLYRRQWSRAAAVGVAALAPTLAFGAISLANGSYFLPNPLMVKAVGEGESALASLLKPFGDEDVAFFANNRAMPALLGLGLVAAAVGWRAKRTLLRAEVLLPLLLAGMILLHGHFVFSPLYWAYRYDAYLVGFGIFVAASVLAGLKTPRGLPQGTSAAVLVLALVPLIADVGEGLLPEAEIRGARGTYLEQFQTAKFIRDYYPAGAVVVNDLGAVTYYTEARILDVVGLGDIEPVRIMRRSSYTGRDVEAWTAPYHPRLAVLSLGWSVVEPLVPRGWVRVAVVDVPPDHHRLGFFAVDPSEAWPLRASVEGYYGPLAQTYGHRVKLRPAEELSAQAAASSAAGTPR